MNFSSKIFTESKTCPGVSFTISRFTEGRRIELSLKLAEVKAELEQFKRDAIPLAEKAAPVVEQLKAAITAQDKAAIEQLSKNLDFIDIIEHERKINSLIQNKIDPVYVRALLLSIDGLTIDDEPATVESIINNGPRELYAEIVSAVRHELGLSEEELGNSASPSTSTALVDGQTKIMSAEPVSDAATT